MCVDLFDFRAKANGVIDAKLVRPAVQGFQLCLQPSSGGSILIFQGHLHRSVLDKNMQMQMSCKNNLVLFWNLTCENCRQSRFENARLKGWGVKGEIDRTPGNDVR